MTGKQDKGFTLIELLIVVAIISIIAAIAVPNLMKARMAGQETSALTSLKTINASEVAYSTSCGNNGFATSFPVLAPFISDDLGVAAPVKSGYAFTLAPSLGAVPGPPDCNGVVTSTGYYATAVPTAFDSTGGKSYATNQRNTVWQVWAATAPTEPFGPPAVPAG